MMELGADARGLPEDVRGMATSAERSSQLSSRMNAYGELTLANDQHLAFLRLVVIVLPTPLLPPKPSSRSVCSLSCILFTFALSGFWYRYNAVLLELLCAERKPTESAEPHHVSETSQSSRDDLGFLQSRHGRCEELSESWHI